MINGNGSWFSHALDYLRHDWLETKALWTPTWDQIVALAASPFSHVLTTRILESMVISLATAGATMVLGYMYLIPEMKVEITALKSDIERRTAARDREMATDRSHVEKLENDWRTGYKEIIGELAAIRESIAKAAGAQAQRDRDDMQWRQGKIRGRESP